MIDRRDDIYDLIVVGGGHAGCEAALAASRMNARTLLLTMNLGTVAQMSCNPAIGGLAKGHLVKEIDALGGAMGYIADESGIQFRMLNKSKGPAVWSPRAQEDRVQYSLHMRSALEQQNNLHIKQDTAIRMLISDGRICGVKTATGATLSARAVVLAPGTFLNGLMHIGLTSFPAGRAGEFSSQGITEDLMALGFEIGRLKTGTPPRIDGRTVDWSQCVPQLGDEEPEPFSYIHERIDVVQVPCYLTWTNDATHRILLSGLDRSPLYTGKIVGTGPRYCPSIETKIVRFADKSRHQIFLEPEGRMTREYYVNGFATSLPEDIQIKGLRSMPGLEKVEATRMGYAIEYDFVQPLQLQPTLESKKVRGLFLAGQINGTSGYEEAAAQGLMAGINAVLGVMGENPFVLDRSEAYIGVLIDDLVTKGTSEPYRMFTSLAEYRLILRQDNANLRLIAHAEKYGIADRAYCERTQHLRRAIAETIEFIRGCKPDVADVNKVLESRGSSPVAYKTSLLELLRRPEISISDFKGLARHHVLSGRHDHFWNKVKQQVEIEIKYEGFIKRQQEQIERFREMEQTRLPADVNYGEMLSLSAEGREKLEKVRPRSLGQASRITGVRQGDIAVLMVYLSKGARERRKCST